MGFAVRQGCFQDESLCTVCFPPPSVMKQQSSEARAMATASAALTMRSKSQDINLGTTITKERETEASAHTHLDPLEPIKCNLVFKRHRFIGVRSSCDADGLRDSDFMYSRMQDARYI